MPPGADQAPSPCLGPAESRLRRAVLRRQARVHGEGRPRAYHPQSPQRRHWAGVAGDCPSAGRDHAEAVGGDLTGGQRLSANAPSRRASTCRPTRSTRYARRSQPVPTPSRTARRLGHRRGRDVPDSDPRGVEHNHLVIGLPAGGLAQHDDAEFSDLMGVRRRVMDQDSRARPLPPTLSRHVSPPAIDLGRADGETGCSADAAQCGGAFGVAAPVECLSANLTEGAEHRGGRFVTSAPSRDWLVTPEPTSLLVCPPVRSVPF